MLRVQSSNVRQTGIAIYKDDIKRLCTLLQTQRSADFQGHRLPWRCALATGSLSPLHLGRSLLMHLQGRQVDRESRSRSKLSCTCVTRLHDACVCVCAGGGGGGAGGCLMCVSLMCVCVCE